MFLFLSIASVKSGLAVCAVVASSRNHDIMKNVMIATLYVALHLLAFSVYRCDAFDVPLSHFDYSILNTETVLSNTRDANSRQCPCFYTTYDNSTYDVLKRHNNINVSVITPYETKCTGVSCISYVQSIYGKVIYMRYIEENYYRRNQYSDVQTCQYYMGFTEGCDYDDCISINTCNTERLLSASVIRHRIFWNGNYYDNALRVIFWYISYVNCDLSCPTPTNSEITKTYLIYLLPEPKPIQKEKFKQGQGISIMGGNSKLHAQQERYILQYEK